MAKHSVCLCEGKLIPIEYIFTVYEGKQINIPEKIKWLRDKSRKGELFCKCGCGANMILVAGDRGLREQHFRMKSGTGNGLCTAVEETDESRLSKIVLKCWLDDKLSDPKLQFRVPLTQLVPDARKFTLTFYDKKTNLAVCFWNYRNNIDSEKILAIDSCKEIGSKILITSWHNTGGTIQYPEYLMKIQKVQGYNLFLKLSGDDLETAYQNAVLEVKVQVQDRNGFWKELPVLSVKLSKYEISGDGTLLYAHKPIERFVKEVLERFDRDEERLKRQEEEQKRLAEEAIKREEVRRQREKEQEERERAQRNAAWERKIEELKASLKHEPVKKKEPEANAMKKETAPKVPITERDFENAQKPITDSDGKRWLKCRFCGKISTSNDFCDIGYPSQGLGKCNDCNRNGVISPEVAKLMQKPENEPKPEKTYSCKVCGSKLVKRSGPYGYYWGCSKYPYCRYTTKKLTD